MNESMYDRWKIEIMPERVEVWPNECTIESMTEWRLKVAYNWRNKNEFITEQMIEVIYDWTDKRVKVWPNEWTIECVAERMK